MRSYSFYTILLLCLVILIVDVLAFYWLSTITQLIHPTLKTMISALFWLFSIGLMTSILILKVRLDDVDPKRKQLLISSLYGLTVSSFIPKLIFVIVITILYLINYSISETASLIVVPLVGLFSGFLPFFVILFGIFRTLYRFKTYHVKILFENLPKTFDGLRIVQLSDAHLGSFNHRFPILRQVVNTVNDLKPDFIFFTGDLVNNYSWELRGWQRVFGQLESKRGKYSVLGNHDYGDYGEWESIAAKQANFEEIKQFYQGIDFKLLLNESEIISNSEEEIAIIGVENWGSPPFKQFGDLQKGLEKVKNVPFKILLSHDPTHWAEEVVDKTNVALTLSGHTHGMQAGFEYKEMKWSPIKYKYKHWAGLYNVKQQFLYVNRGLGWLGFPGRLGMRPEITLMELKSSYAPN